MSVEQSLPMPTGLRPSTAHVLDLISNFRSYASNPSRYRRARQIKVVNDKFHLNSTGVAKVITPSGGVVFVEHWSKTTNVEWGTRLSAYSFLGKMAHLLGENDFTNDRLVWLEDFPKPLKTDGNYLHELDLHPVQRLRMAGLVPKPGMPYRPKWVAPKLEGGLNQAIIESTNGFDLGLLDQALTMSAVGEVSELHEAVIEHVGELLASGTRMS